MRQRSSSETLPHTEQNLHAVADLAEHRGQPVDVRRLDRQQVKRDALRALRPDARQLAQFVDQILDGALKHGSQVRPRKFEAAEAAGQRTELALRHHADLPRRVL